MAFLESVEGFNDPFKLQTLETINHLDGSAISSQKFHNDLIREIKKYKVLFRIAAGSHNLGQRQLAWQSVSKALNVDGIVVL